MAIKANLVIDQGTDYSTSITLTDDDDNVVDLTSYTASAQMRKTYSSSNAISFSTTLYGETGIVQLQLSANQTANIVPGRFVYDVMVHETVTDVRSRIVEGIVTVTPRVTQ
jgi:hypothetical protein